MRGHNWTPAEDAAVVADYKSAPGAVRRLAAKFGVSEQAVIGRARKLGLNARIHRWTAAEDATMRREYGRTHTAALAARFGASIEAVQKRARRLGLTQRFDFLRHQIERVKEHYANQQHQLSAMLADYGLPADLRVREFQILLTLVDGPATRTQIAKRLGMPVHQQSRRMMRSNDPGHSYTGRLIARGLITRQSRFEGGGRRGAGRRPDLYLLTVACMAMFAGKEVADGR